MNIISRYWVPRWVVDRSWQILRQDGLKGVESTVTWGGIRFGEAAVVMGIVYPCGRDVELYRGFIRVGPDTTAEMGRWLRGQGLAGLMQVHTHPTAWTGHSGTDDDYPIASSEGFVSIVWPTFAQLPVRDAGELGVHRLEGGRWRELERAEVQQLVRIVESEGLIWAHSEDLGHARGASTP
ncbi:MAG: hypothetical protein DMD33_09435 [Gemmatimonadetes bacterium]|nr:MAG: hypothetical protein DMD33_09435 [Gemmatimonadota bacterium]